MEIFFMIGQITKINRAISKTFKFECSHRLNLNYGSPCLSLHGHSYKVKVTVYSNDLNKNGMIIDFVELKEFQEYLDRIYDHSVIVNKQDTELLKFVKSTSQKYVEFETNTTSEKIAESLCTHFYEMFKDRINMRKLIVTVWETEKNEACFIIEEA